MSGSGRLALLASKRGHCVTAIDRSPDIIALSRYQDWNVTFTLGNVLDAREVHYRIQADVVTCGGKSVSLLSKTDRCLLFNSIRTSLRPGGYLLGDSYSRFSSKATIANIIPLNLLAGRLLWIETHTYPLSSTMVTNFLLEPNNLIGDPQYRMLSSQRHWGIDPDLLSQELAAYDLKVEEIIEESTSGEPQLEYYRFAARAI